MYIYLMEFVTYSYVEFVTYSHMSFGDCKVFGAHVHICVCGVRDVFVCRVRDFVHVCHISECKAFGVHLHTREARNVFICRVRDSFMYVIQVTAAHCVHTYGVFFFVFGLVCMQSS